MNNNNNNNRLILKISMTFYCFTSGFLIHLICILYDCVVCVCAIDARRMLVTPYNHRHQQIVALHNNFRCSL